MSCVRCNEVADVYVQTLAGSMTFCRCCSESWFSLLQQPASDDFWSLERGYETGECALRGADEIGGPGAWSEDHRGGVDGAA